MKANHDVAQYLSLGGEFFNGVKKIVGIGTKEYNLWPQRELVHHYLPIFLSLSL